MRISEAQLLPALLSCAKQVLGADCGWASDEKAVLSGLAILAGGLIRKANDRQRWLSSLTQQLQALRTDEEFVATVPDIHTQVTALCDAAQKELSSAASDTADDLILSRWALLSERIACDERLDKGTKARLVGQTANNDLERIRSQVADPPAIQGSYPPITAAKLEGYLQHRFSDPSIKITSFESVHGGYGKETSLFEVTGTALSGGYAIRRDRATPPMNNDCHCVHQEFPLLRAAFARDFPTPEALWFDQEHPRLPGGHFMVMRRVPGAPGGSVLASNEATPAPMISMLAKALATLHSLQAMVELGDISTGIRQDLWDKPLKEVVERYIRGMRDMYIADMPVVSPAILCVFGWLFDNMPDIDGRPVLLHGDFGFHNMIVENHQLRAVVDWEFAHIGDPAEDVAYLQNAMSGTDSFARFLREYRAFGGIDIDPCRLHFFRIWGHLRNAVASELTSAVFASGKTQDLKLAHVAFTMTPLFVGAAQELIAAKPV